MAIKFSRRDKKYGCFSNFTPCTIVFDGITYKSTEAAWQAQKTLDKKERESFSNLSPSEAKKKGRHVNLRKDWEDVKYELMVEICLQKFRGNSEYEKTLIYTGDEEIIEDTTGWHDNVWGNCDCPKCINKPGRNLLGKALMEVRERLWQENKVK